MKFRLKGLSKLSDEQLHHLIEAARFRLENSSPKCPLCKQYSHRGAWTMGLVGLDGCKAMGCPGVLVKVKTNYNWPACYFYCLILKNEYIRTQYLTRLIQSSQRELRRR